MRWQRQKHEARYLWRTGEPARTAARVGTGGALDHPRAIELLITRVRFAEGTPNGAALARMALVKRPGIKVLFVSFPEVEMQTEGIGEFLPRPFSQDELLTVVGGMVHQ